MRKTFSQMRATYVPKVPALLEELEAVQLIVHRQARIDPKVLKYFSPSFAERNDVYFLKRSGSSMSERRPLKVGVLLSGGPAPGGHAVLSALVDAVFEHHPKSQCIGFLNGPKGLLLNDYRGISQKEVQKVRHTGGFDFLGTGRDKIAGDQALQQVLEVVENHQLDGLVIIGGDDSNTNAAILADYFERHQSKTCVIGVPKTIDNDILAPELSVTFGFDTATKTYIETIGNIAKDLLSGKKQYFFMRLMGRDASHITLECALKTHPNLALISEEILQKKMTLQDVVYYVADLVDERLQAQKPYGMVLLPEGLIESLADVRELIVELNTLLSKDSILAKKSVEKRYHASLSLLTPHSKECLERFPPHLAQELFLDRDSHGNISVSKIETGRLLALLVGEELQRRTAQDARERPFSWQSYFCGYEGRCQYPTDFDFTYCSALGRLAAVCIEQRLNGYLVAIDNVTEDVSKWTPCCIPLISMMTEERRHGVLKPVIAKVVVDLKGKPFQSFMSLREGWCLSDDYQQPGPIQYGLEAPSR